MLVSLFEHYLSATRTSTEELAYWALIYVVILTAITVVLRPKGFWMQLTVVVSAAIVGDFYHNLTHAREVILNFIFIIFSCAILWHFWRKREAQ